MQSIVPNIAGPNLSQYFSWTVSQKWTRLDYIPGGVAFQVNVMLNDRPPCDNDPYKNG